LDRFGPVSLSIYNLNGRLVNKLINDTMHPGNYNSIWNGTNLRGNQVSSGIYLAVLESNGMLVQTQKLVLLK
jgi:flagellar hook assembly protein FlgD